MSSFFKNVGNDVVFTGVYMEAYIPQMYYDRGIAEEYGESTKVMGLFNVRFFSDAEGKKPIGKLETVNIPTIIDVFPSSYENREIELIKGVEMEQYVVLKFYNNDIFTKSSVTQSASNCEIFLRLLNGGKIPPTIPYNEIIDIWRRNMDINGVQMRDVPAVIFELIVAEIYRDGNKHENKFGKTMGLNPNTSPYAYQAANIRFICKYNSTFTAITSEDTDSMLTTALNINKTGRKQTLSPIEKIMKY